MSAMKTITIRLSESELEKVNALAKKYGKSQSQVVRLALEALFKYVDMHDGMLHLPIDLMAEWRKIDHGASRSLRVAEDAAGGYVSGQPAETDMKSAADGRKASKAVKGNVSTDKKTSAE